MVKLVPQVDRRDGAVGGGELKPITLSAPPPDREPDPLVLASEPTITRIALPVAMPEVTTH